MSTHRWTFALTALVGLALLVSACSGAATGEPTGTAAGSQTEASPVTGPATTVEAENEPAAEDRIAGSSCDDPFGESRATFIVRYWEKTDFCKHNVEFSSITSGGPPPDGIPAIDRPKFESFAAGDEWLGPEWPVMAYEHNGDARAYPLAILIYHEIANDTVGGQPVALTFCPLCNSTIAFNRIAPDGRELDFGTTGNLRKSDLVMYDRQTESWWQQITGEAIVGEYTGAQLEFLPSQILAWQDFKAQYPDGQVLSRDTGHSRGYGNNPYGGYDSLDNQPFLFRGFPDDRLPAMERVTGIEIGDTSVAYPFSVLQEERVINDEVEGEPLVVFWQAGVKSSLDSGRMENSRDVGTSAVFNRRVDDQTLTFEAAGEQSFRDLETGSTWNLLGEATDGPLAGTKLESIVHGQHFWFAWAAFLPDTEIRTP